VESDRFNRIPRRMMEVMVEETQELLSEFLREVVDPERLMAFVQSNMGLDMSQTLGGIKQQPGFDAYRILGLERSATEQEVKHRYNELIRILHPDKSGTPGTNFLFQCVLAAYEVIKQERGWK
jgi:hypothetical protein